MRHLTGFARSNPPHTVVAPQDGEAGGDDQGAACERWVGYGFAEQECACGEAEQQSGVAEAANARPLAQVGQGASPGGTIPLLNRPFRRAN